MGSTKSVLANIGEILGAKSSEFSFLNPPLITAPNSSILTLDGQVRKLRDPSKRLRPSFGIEKVLTKTLSIVNDEKGPTGQRVSKIQGDDRVRLVGDWTTDHSNLGQHAFTGTIGDFVEIVFWGTGLNVLLFQDATARDFRVSIDGGAEGANIYTANSNIISNRGLEVNYPVNIANGLTLGLHTARIRQNTGSTNFRLYGFEILNASSTNIQVSQGELFVAGKKYTLSNDSSHSYNSGFDGNPVLNGRGGHVVEYLTDQGQLGKAIQQTESSALYLTSANHSNESPIHRTNWREFSAGRGDDFGTGNSGSRAFVMPDNVTAITALGLAPGSDSSTVGVNASGDFLNIVFVGTGLDLVQNELPSTFSGTHDVILDGVTIFSGNLSSTVNRGVWKICSGLPFGTHTFRFRKTSAGSGIAISDIIVYGPKKPSIPANAVELQDYYLMANYDGSTITGTSVDANIQMPIGAIAKSVLREVQYVGANWAVSSVLPSAYPLFGFNTGTLTNNNQPYTFSFVGTGFVIQNNTHSGLTYDFSVTVDGALNASGVARSNATNLGGGSYRASSGASGNEPVRIEFTGLTYGRHTVTVQRTAGSGNFSVAAFHIITPTYSPNLRLGWSSLGDGIQTIDTATGKEADLSKAKAWVMVNQSTGAVLASYNISAVQANGAGTSLIYFERPFASSNYLILATGDQLEHDVWATIDQSPNYCEVIARTSGGSATNDARLMVVFFGELKDETT